MPNTGNVIVTERDVNPFSSTFNTTRTRTYQDHERCVPYTAPVWTVQSSACETVDGYNTGYVAIVETDTNQYSSTYNTTRTRYVFDLTECALTSGLKIAKIYGEHEIILKVDCDGLYLQNSDVTPYYTRNNSSPNVNVMMHCAVIGECVTKIAQGAFQGNSYVREVYVPSTVTTIYQVAFWGCANLDNLTLPSVVSIYRGAFKECVSLKNIDLGSSLTTIDDEVFKDCEFLDNVVLPSTVTTIGNEVFSGCSRINSLTCLATTPPSLGTNTFSSTADNQGHTPVIYVPAASVNTYKEAIGWSSYAHRIQAIPEP